MNNIDARLIDKLFRENNKKELDLLLCQACIDFDTKIVNLLLKYGANPNVVHGSNQSPLHNAVIYQHHSLLERLFKNGADINIQNEDGNTPLHFAASQMHASILATLIEKANINIKNKKHQTPLDYAIKYGTHYNIVELIAAGGNSGGILINAIFKYRLRLLKEFYNFIRVIIHYKISKS